MANVLGIYQEFHIFPILWAPKLDSVLQMVSLNSGEEGQNHLPQPVGHIALDVGQDVVCFLGCQSTLPDHVKVELNNLEDLFQQNCSMTL